MKDRVNDLTGNKFNRAGLGKGFLRNTLLILDTPLLRTTRMLFSRFVHDIKRLIIAESKSDKATAIREAILTSEFRDSPIEVVNSEVVQYLQSSHEKIDFIWLDFQSDRFELASTIEHHLNNAQCVAITIAGRSRKHKSIEKRVNRITKSFEHTLPYKVIDFGYSMSKKNMPMQLIAYSKQYSPCEYNIILKSGGRFQLAGYPNVKRKRRVQF